MATTNKKASIKTAPAVAVAQVGEVTLEQIVEATKAGSFVYTSPTVHGPLIEAGLVEVNPAMTDEAGNIATRSTQKGTETVNTPVQTAAPVAATSAAGFTIEAGIPMPSISGRGRTGNIYPFDKMEPGHSFFVPNSEDKPNAAKSLASTVSSATARYAVPSADGATKSNKKGETVPVMVETRKFVVRSVEENGVKGARVWRTA